jgi:ABC-type sugar transport system ATPase subunit
LISNDLEEIAGLCDRVLVIEDGKIKQEIKRKDLSVHNLVKALQDW